MTSLLLIAIAGGSMFAGTANSQVKDFGNSPDSFFGSQFTKRLLVQSRNWLRQAPLPDYSSERERDVTRSGPRSNVLTTVLR
jgi:hypothetical protein